MRLTIDVISDVVCPWCYVGKRRLEAALERWRASHPDAPAPEVRWQPFQLNPQLPAEGMSRREYIEQKFGRDRAGQVYDRVTGVGREVGIAFAFDRIERQPNTLAPHALIGAAGKLGIQDAVVEAFFEAYFLEGRDLTDRVTLIEVAAAAGMPRAEVEATLDDPENRERVAREDEHARAIGVSGVPFFIFNGRLGVSGAHPAEVLVDAMEQAEAA